jgi:monofunctional biosynthetic peptidoglycan transglycosylase
MSELSRPPDQGHENTPVSGHSPRMSQPQAAPRNSFRRADESALSRMVRQAPAALVDSFVAATKVLVLVGVLFVVLFGAVLVLFRYVDPPGSMLMLTQRLQGIDIDRRWVPLGEISPYLIRSVVASEDSNFCRHHGIDFGELAAAIDKAEDKGDELVRGASTITMQVAKNLFLSPARNLIRKGVEMTMAVGMEVVWPKSRILEIYLNIAEWGPGVFGAEAGAQYHFRKSAARLTPGEAALMAVSLPNPIVRRAGRPGPGLQRLAGVIEARARRLGDRLACIPR